MHTPTHNTSGKASPALIIVAVILVVIIGTILVVDRQVTQEAGTEQPLEPAENFVLQDHDGNTVQLSDFGGGVVIANSWATWCPFCVDELPDFALLQEEFGDQITVIAINRQESLETTQGYASDLGISDDLVFLLDPEDIFYKSAGGFGMPVTLFIDAEGNIVITKRGVMPLEEMREKTLETLAASQSISDES